MKFLITGASGFIGAALASSLEQEGHEVRRLVRDRRQIASRSFYWNPAESQIDVAALAGIDAIVHLAGENLASGRWTVEKKQRIRESRLVPTRLLAETVARLPGPPSVFISASAIGIYGDRGSEWLSESSPAGSEFLAEVCQAWETATEPARQAGVRRVLLRLGLVLSPDGGALAKMLVPFRFGLGGVIGPGEQFVSWITREDLLEVFRHACVCPELQGPVNAVSPHPVTNRTFTHALAGALRRPALLRMPAPVVRMIFGEMARETLLSSARVFPGRLQETGFDFTWPELDPALRNML